MNALIKTIERVTGRKFDEFCTTEIFRPLRMNDTVFRPGGELLNRVAPSSAPERGLVDDTVARLAGGVAAHASLFTTTADMARFARMMLNLGELDGVRVLKPETVRLKTSVQSPAGLTSLDAKNRPVRRNDSIPRRLFFELMLAQCTQIWALARGGTIWVT